jgi:hypothetical protein
MFGRATGTLAEAFKFRVRVMSTSDGKEPGWVQRFVLPLVRYVGALLFVGSFAWTFGAWAFYDIAFEQALIEGIAIYLASAICLTFDTLYFKATSGLFLMSEAFWKRSRPFGPLQGKDKGTCWDQRAPEVEATSDTSGVEQGSTGRIQQLDELLDVVSPGAIESGERVSLTGVNNA